MAISSKATGKPAAQVRISTPSTMADYRATQYTWVSTELKPKVGQFITCAPDKREWLVDLVGVVVNHFEGLATWK